MSKAKSRKSKQKSKASGEISERLEHVFLAGLGALSSASEVGAKTFESLVDQGQAYRKKASKTTDRLIGDVQEAVRDVAEGAQSRATGLIGQVRSSASASRLNEVFDERVDSALRRIGVPTRNDIGKLNAKLDKLMALAQAKPTKAAAKKKATKKVAKKKASRKVAKKTARRKVAKKSASK